MAHIGIDLGTTNSLIAVFQDGKPELIKNSMGAVLTPSVVSLDGDILVSGDLAKARLVTHPSQSAALFKRTMGADKTYRLGRKKFTAAELSAVILQSLKTDAETFLGTEVKDVIISVPAYFNEIQRKSVKAAGLMAGLNPLRLINEPTAAALTYGLQDLEAESTFLVYDLGGGTFDVSILEVFDGVMEVKATAGDAYLGGDDFTAKLADYISEKRPDAAGDNNRPAVMLLAENVKLGLSEKHNVTLDTAINGKNIQLTVTRDDFETLTESLLKRLRRPVERSLYDARISVKDIAKVVLVGGATRMPVIKSLVAKQLRKLPESKLDPDHVVALGAAVQAALVGKNKALKDVVMTDVSAFTLGMETSRQLGRNFKEGYFLPIIERNSAIPISLEAVVSTVEIGQRKISINIFQGEAPVVNSNIFLGALDVTVPANRKAHEEVAIRLTYDVSGLLEVDATILSTGKKSSLLITKLAGDISPAEIKSAQKTLSSLKTHPRDQSQNKLLRARLEQCFAMARFADREEIQELLMQFDAAIDRQDLTDIAQMAEQITGILNRFESSYVT